jgi:hypothetical protein
LRKQIENLESGRAEPGEVPDMVRDIKPGESSSNGTAAGEHGQREDAPSYSGGGSTTPRLDARLGDQR